MMHFYELRAEFIDHIENLPDNRLEEAYDAFLCQQGCERISNLPDAQKLALEQAMARIEKQRKERDYIAARLCAPYLLNC